MARRLGHYSIGHLRASMSQREYVAWVAYLQLEAKEQQKQYRGASMRGRRR